MNYSASGTVTIPGKKTGFSSATRALIVGLVFLLPGAAAQAGEPIEGVSIKLTCCFRTTPGGITVSAPTGPNGAYQFTGLVPGKYDLSVAGQRVQTISVGANRRISGVLSRDGAQTSITFNGQVGVVADLPSYPITGIIISLPANPDASKAAENDSPLPTTRGTAPKPDGADKKSGIIIGFAPLRPAEFATAPPPKDDKLSRKTAAPKPDWPASHAKEGGSALPVSTTREIAPRPDGGDKKPGISDQGAAGGLISYGTAPPPKDGKLPGITGTQDNAAGIHVAPGDVNGDGRAELRAVLPKADQAEKSRFKIADNESPRPADRGNQKFPGKAATTVTVTPVNDPPSITGTPIVGIPIGIEGDPDGFKVSATTDANGAFNFTKLPAGKYKLTLPGQPAESVTIGTDGTLSGQVMSADASSGTRAYRITNVRANASAGKNNDNSAGAGAVPGKGADIFDRWGQSPISGSSGGFGGGAGPSAGPGMNPGAGPGAMGGGPGAMGGRR